jgi:DNA-binding transcriptional LysR family regulator
MDTADIDWSLYRSFLAVLREGSLSGAARALGTTQPSVGRHISALEAAMGLPLFTRSQDGLRPTPTALELRQPAEAMATAVQQAARIASGSAQEEGGTVRLTASQIIGGEVLPELLARFHEQHPRITIELVLNNLNDDLLQREADIAVRMAKPTQKALIAKKLGRIDVGLYAHQRYAKARGLPRSLADLPQHTLIGADTDVTAFRMAQQAGFPIAREIFQLRCDNDLAQLAAMRAGYGIGGCHIGIAQRDASLVPVLADQITFSLDMWLLTHGDLRRNKRVMALYRYLTQHLSAYVLSSQRLAG